MQKNFKELLVQSLCKVFIQCWPLYVIVLLSIVLFYALSFPGNIMSLGMSIYGAFFFTFGPFGKDPTEFDEQLFELMKGYCLSAVLFNLVYFVMWLFTIFPFFGFIAVGIVGFTYLVIRDMKMRKEL